MTIFPSVDEALELHRVVIERFGGDGGVRDLGLLESALYRPQTGYYEDLIQMAAALMESLLINHPFVDGNKRVAFFLTDIFLRLNGHRIKVGAKIGYRFIHTMLASKTFRLPTIEHWLRKHVAKSR